MRFIPTHCDTCERSSLSPEHVVRNGLGTCATCGQPMQPLPGESYSDCDLSLFQQLESAVRQAKLGIETVAFLRSELSRAGQGTPGRGLRSVITTVPALAIFEIIVGPEPAALRKAEGILLLLLEGLRRSHTRVVAAVQLDGARPSGGVGQES